MRILFLTSRLPFPPHRGDRVRTYNFLKRLSRDHDVHLISFIESNQEMEHLPALEPLCKVETVLLNRRASFINMLRHAASILPFQVLYYRSPEMQRKVERCVRDVKFDLIYTHLFRMVPFSPKSSGAIRILDLTDCISRELRASLPYRPRLLRLPLRMEIERIRHYEGEVSSQFDEVWTISDSDRDAIIESNPNAKIEVVPNGVDSSLFDCRPERGGNRVGFLGNFSVPHNIDAANFLASEIMPRVLKTLPDATLELIGHGVTGDVRRLDRNNNTVVTGPVEKLSDGLGGLTLFVSPLRFSAGIQNKIIEAMAAGVPVLTTSFGNWGLRAEPDKEIVIRDDPDQFADAVISLLQDPDRAARLGENGRSFVRSRFSWESVADRVAAFDSTASPSTGR